MAVTLITGCSSGFGLATSLAFAGAGHTVFAGVRSPTSAGALGQAAREASGRIQIVPLDVTDDASVHAAVSRVQDTAGRLDVVINNAGVGYLGAVETMPIARVREVFETNVLGVLTVLRAVLPTMRAQHSGVIVNVSTVAARLPARPIAGIYVASKRALDALTEALAGEVAPFGIHVALVEPGFSRTGAVDKFAAALRELDEAPATPYRDVERVVTSFFQRMTAAGTAPEDVAQTVLAIVEQPAGRPLHNVVGAENAQLVQAARTMSEEEWNHVMRARTAQMLASSGPSEGASP